MRVEWKLHVRPQLYRYDSRGQAIGKPIDLSPYDHAGLHRLFSSHYQRDETVEAPGLAVRTWRRLFGWAYGISTMEAAVLFVCAGAVPAAECLAQNHESGGQLRPAPAYTTLQ